MLRMSVEIGKIAESEELVPNTPKLTLSELQRITSLGHVESENLVIERSLKGRTLKKRVTIPLMNLLNLGQQGLAEYIVSSLIRERPALIPFALGNQSLVEFANYLLRYRSASLQAYYTYTQTLKQFSDWFGHPPDRILEDTKGPNGLVDPQKLAKHSKILQSWSATLQDRQLAPGRVQSCVGHVKSWYKVNGATITLPYTLSRRVTRKDRAPRPEELQRVLKVANLREKVMVLMPTLGGFREETMSKLEYRHVREDLEAKRTPIHISVEVEIVKGKYGSYDTFLGEEGVDSLRLYLDSRRRGSPYTRNGTPEMPPEDLTDESPLIRDSRSPVPRSIGPKQFRKIVHHLYLRAGIIKEQSPKPGATKNSPRIMYDVRFHSLRKFFKTQMVAAGVPESHVEYFMGHVSDTYNDVQALGVEKLRSIYSSANLSIRPNSAMTKLDRIREFAEALGVPRNKFHVEPDTKYIDPQEKEKVEIRLAMQAIRDELLKPQTG